MSQKKPTTNQQLEEMREMITELKNQEPGKVISVDRQLQERNQNLTQLLYAAIAKHGMGHPDMPNGVIVSSQVPAIQIPAEQQLGWEVSQDGRTVMVYIVQTEPPAEDGTDKAETSPEEGEEAATAEADSPEPFPGSTSIADEYEDEIEVGLGD